MTNDEAKAKLCPFDKKFCCGSGCMAFKMTHAPVVMADHNDSKAMREYAAARGRSWKDVRNEDGNLILDAEYDCRRLYDQKPLSD